MWNQGINMKLPNDITFSAYERRIFKPKEKITVSRWAELHRYVAKGPAQGRWSNAMTPYLVKPMDQWNLPWVRKIFLCFGPQIGKTQVAINCLMFAIDQDPGAAMYIMSAENTAKRLMRRQILPAVKSSPRVAELMSDRDADSTQKGITFKNGMDLMMAWATSASEMASESVRYLFLDEPGKYPPFAGKEADPFSLAEARTNAYPHTKKIMYFSTPNVEGDAFSNALESDVDVVYRYEACCPFCHEFQFMDFENIHWSGLKDHRVIQRKKLGRYSCVKCGMDWNDAYRNDAVRDGRWVESEWPWIKKSRGDGIVTVEHQAIERPASVGFHLPSWYSTFISLSDVAEAFLKGKEDPNKMQAFVTQHRAEPWKETIELKDETAVLKHRVQTPVGVVPSWAVALTAGIDMQKHGFWFVVRAWDKDLRSHLVQYGTLSAWEDVVTLCFETQYPVEGSDRKMGVWRAALDTGGGLVDDDDWSRTEEAYQFLREYSRGKIFGIKGSSRPMINRIRRSVQDRFPRSNRPIPGGLELRIIDTHQFKGLLHWRLSRKEGESQYFSLHADTGLDYAKQLLAEELRRNRAGKVEWHQNSKNNHLLDAEVYSAACADSEWTPALSFLARNTEAEEQNLRENRQKSPSNHVENHEPDRRSRPAWFRA